MIYLVLITDTSWNRNFNKAETGAEEVRGCFEDLYERFPGQVHTTLVALGVSGPTGFEDLLNAVIGVTHEELSDGAAVAEKVGVYVMPTYPRTHPAHRAGLRRSDMSNRTTSTDTLTLPKPTGGWSSTYDFGAGDWWSRRPTAGPPQGIGARHGPAPAAGRPALKLEREGGR